MTPDEANCAFEALAAVQKMLEQKAVDFERQRDQERSQDHDLGAFLCTAHAGLCRQISGQVEAMMADYAEIALGEAD